MEYNSLGLVATCRDDVFKIGVAPVDDGLLWTRASFKESLLGGKLKKRGLSAVAPPGIYIGGKYCRGLGRSPRKSFFDHALYFGYKRDQRL